MIVPLSAARAAILAAASALAVAAPAQAEGETNLTANYTISVARIPVGKAAWSLDIGGGSYTTKGTGEASGVASLAVSGKGSVAAQGTVTDGRLDATEFTADITRGDEKGKVYLVIYKFEGGKMIQCMRVDNKSRPGEFTGQAGSGNLYEVWKRVE